MNLLVSSTVACFLLTLFISLSFAQDPVWQVNIGRNPSSQIYSMELDEDGSLYIPLYITEEGGLVKVSKDGVKEWQYIVPNQTKQVMGSPRIVGDAVVLVTGWGGAYAYFIDRETGELIKEQELVKIGLEGNPYYYSKPSVSTNGNYVYINLTHPATVFGFNTSSFDLIGKYRTGYGPSHSPQVTSFSDVMYFGTEQGIAFSAYPYALIDNFGEGDIDKINFAQDPSGASLTRGLYLLGPAINYKERKLYFFDRQGKENLPALLVLNLGDGTLLKTTSLPKSLDTDSPPLIDTKGNVFLLTYNNTGNTKNTLFKFNSDGEQIASHTFDVNYETYSTPVVDNQGSVYIQLDKLYKLNNSLDEVLFAFDLIPYGNSGSVGSSLTLSEDQTSLYFTTRDGTVLNLATDYQEAGCIRDYYCDSTPKHHPIIFVHGLGGKDTDWLEGNKAGMRDLILEEYRQDDPEFPDSWAYAYHYGYDNNGNYNYQGDIRQIAKGLQEDVARLAKESLDAGGDGQVDIVGFSLGGQIIREYLAQMVRSMETEEDDRPHHIANAIIIASPNKGSWAYAQSQKIPWPAGAISNQAANAYFAWSADNGQPINATAAALEQLKPDSSFMERVANRYATNVSYSTLYGDISGTVKQNLFGVQLGGKTSIGDTLLTADSASDIPNINEESYSFDSDVDVNVKIDIGNSSVAAELEFPTPMDYWKWQHRDLIEQPEIHQKVLEILEGV